MITHLQEEVEKLNQSDFLRHYLFMMDKYKKMKEENPKQLSVMLCYVKNPEKNKIRTYKARNLAKERKMKSQPLIDT